jgi:hypothetical protein
MSFVWERRCGSFYGLQKGAVCVYTISQVPRGSEPVKKTWMPIAAGILDIVCAIIHCFLIASFISCLNSVTGRSLTLNECLVILIVAAPIVCLEYIGGVYALARKRWGLALATSIVALIFCWFLGIPSLILTILSKNEFK